MLPLDVVFTNALLPTGERGDIVVRAGIIDSIGSVAPAGSASDIVDLQGKLVLPGLIDGHIHLDKSMLHDRWQPHRAYTNGFNIHERVAFEKDALGQAAPVRERAARLIETVVAHGTMTMRSHVDIDSRAGLSNLLAVLDARSSYRDLATIEIVAFPQSGIMADPGTAELLDEAIRAGADLIGGLDPVTLDGDMQAHLDIVFGLAERHGIGVDIHLHDGGSTGILEIDDIAARTKALGMEGHVTISHAFALGDVSLDVLKRTAAQLAASGVAILTNAPGHRAFPPVRLLRELGVNVFAGNDNIRDAWRPLGTGDMLERAMLISYRSGFATDEELAMSLDMATYAAARALRLERYGLAVGAPADFIAVAAQNSAEAVVAHRGCRTVFRGGRLVADNGQVMTPRQGNT